MSAFVAMYNPALPGSPHVLAPVRAQALYAAHGWLVVDGTTPVPTNEFLTPFAGDLRYLKVWTPNEVLTAGAVRVAPDGHVITRNGNGTARATYDTTEQALWTAVSGGGGGAVSSVAGRTGVVTLASTDLTDSTATGQALVSAATAAAARTTLGLGSAATQPTSAFDAAGAAAAVLPTQTGNSGKYLTTNGTVASWGTPSGGGTTLTVATTATSAATLVAGKHTPVDATSAALTMPLPAGAAAGTFISAEKFDSTANAVTLSGNIRGVGSSTVQLVWAKEALLLVADSTGSWWPVAGHKTKASLDAAYMTVLVYSGSAYPARPAAAPNGNVRYVGPVQPSDWQSNDEWINTAATGQTFHTVPDAQIGDWVCQAAVATTGATQPNGQLQMGAMWLPAGTYDRAIFNVSGAGSAGSLTKVVVYADSNGRPGSVLLDSATVDTTTIGDKVLTGLAMVIPAGGSLVWAGVVTQGAPTTVPGIVQVNQASTQKFWAGTQPTVGFMTAPSVLFTGLTGAAPTTAPGVTSGFQYANLGFRRGS